MFYSISEKDFNALLSRLNADYQVYAPFVKGEKRFYKKYENAVKCEDVAGIRAFEPLKAFFFGGRTITAKDFSPDCPQTQGKPYCIVGAKACDLKAFKIQDSVFNNNDYKDPFYLKARGENLIISSDCSFAAPTCFCLALGIKPYPQDNFDINLSPAQDGFVAETGSPKGDDLVSKYPGFFKPSDKNMLAAKDSKRLQTVKEVEKNLQAGSIPTQDSYVNIIEKSYTSQLWQDEAETCVECGACNTICPTCHCFFLYDQMKENKMARMRVWDSCMIKDFARVAGGANPRKRLWMRLRNRFEKKFDFFPKTTGIYACTGCGRCISACPAKIDIRKVLKKLVQP